MLLSARPSDGPAPLSARPEKGLRLKGAHQCQPEPPHSTVSGRAGGCETAVEGEGDAVVDKPLGGVARKGPRCSAPAAAGSAEGPDQVVKRTPRTRAWLTTSSKMWSAALMEVREEGGRLRKDVAAAASCR